MRQKATLLPEAPSTLVTITLFSVVINLLGLAGAIYMFQVYDRVLTSFSTATLVVLTIIVAVLFLAQGIVIVLRGMLATRLAGRLQSRNIVWALTESGRRARGGAEKQRTPSSDKTPAEDLEAVVNGLRGGGLVAVLDAAWAPVYLIILTLLAPWVGLFATAVVVLFVLVSLVTAHLRTPAAEPQEEEMPARSAWQAALRSGNAAPAASAETVAQELASGRDQGRETARLDHERQSVMRGFSTTVRNVAQSGVLAVGAWLVITDQATLGIVMAGVILMGRIFGPVELLLRERKTIREARAGWRRLKAARRQSLTTAKGATAIVDEDALRGMVKVRGLAAAPVPQAPPTVAQVSFELEPGQVLLVVGHSGAGKTLLLRTLAGLHASAQGSVSFGNARLSRLDSAIKERLIGYLPQEQVFLPGTIADAIARHDRSIGREEIVEAAKRAGAHERISAQGKGYDTALPPLGPPLPYGIMRLIGLARALCREPHLLVLDDPLAGLHPGATKFVTEAIAERKRAGGIVIIAGQPAAFRELTDKVLMLAEGKMQSFGSPAEVFKPRRVGPAAVASMGGEHA